MKAKDFKSPYTWESRHPCIADRTLFLPDFCPANLSYQLPAFSELFGNDHPVCIEYCSGNGDWLLDKAKNDPSRNWIGVEMRFDRIQKIVAKRHNLKVENLFLVCGEGEEFTRLIPSHVVSEVYINFPDPWPKRKHEKNRIIKPSFVAALKRILHLTGTLTFVTDDPDYKQIALQHLMSELQSIHPAPFFKTNKPGYGTSFFEELWRQKGKEIFYLEFQKC